MGGGKSGLFFGTKGAQQEYQFSIFPDTIRKDRDAPFSNATNSGPSKHENGTAVSKQVRITAEAVLKKCAEYHSAHITAHQLTEWLSLIVSSPRYKMTAELQRVIVDNLGFLTRHIDSTSVETKAFDSALQMFEKQLLAIMH